MKDIEYMVGTKRPLEEIMHGRLKGFRVMPNVRQEHISMMQDAAFKTPGIKYDMESVVAAVLASVIEGYDTLIKMTPARLMHEYVTFYYYFLLAVATEEFQGIDVTGFREWQDAVIRLKEYYFTTIKILKL